MAISSISQSSYQAFTPVTSNAKSATQADSAADTDTAAKAADPAKAATTAKETAPDEDAKTTSVSKESGGKEGSSAAPTMYKLNPDGTVGPLHLPRPGHAHGVVHA